MPHPQTLADYNAKRDFARTPEPAGEAGTAQCNSFVVQKHAARRLHWDFRLEMDGVLKSWAVTRGPSLDPADKRLAVRTEDHPISYGGFEGIIPQGQYGGGTVMLWDRGSWEPIPGKHASDIEDGHLHFILHGQRMKGEWLLVRIKAKPGERHENWLLRKIDDGEAGRGDSLITRALTSVATGRTMDEIAAGVAARKAGTKPLPFRRGVGVGRSNKPVARGTAPPPSLPPFVEPQLATLVDSVPTGPDWLHEMKYDGYRCLAAIADGAVKLYTRSGLDWTDRFPDIAGAARTLPVRRALIDGEIVAYDPEGRPDFALLKNAIEAGGHGLTMMAFDLLLLDGEDLKSGPLIERKAALQPLLVDAGPIRYADHVTGKGEALFQAMCAKGLEGVVSKRCDAPYRSGRTPAWLKVKCVQRQEFIIIGWSASDKGRGFRSLLLAVREGDALRYAGKVGTGFDAALMEQLRARLEKLVIDKPAAAVPRPAARGAHWVKPVLVAEIAYAEFTPDNVVRHASFIGLRDDKPARQVVRERPAPAPTSVKITHPDRVIFPEAGITKQQLADYYTAIAPYMLRWAAHRPISLVRCPQGRGKHCFFQKHDSGTFGDAIHHIPIQESDGATADYLYVDDAEGVLACVQMGTIEFHGWGARADDIEHPDRLIIDLDPDPSVDFAEVRHAAVHLRDLLAGMGLVSFPMLTGGKGVHVVVPLDASAAWPAVKDFAHRFALAVAADQPDRFVAVMSKAKRKGRIFIDWLRNQRGATAVMPFSARERENAPVAVPLSWDALNDAASAALLQVTDIDAVIEAAEAAEADGWGVAAQALPGV
ncbi:MAG: DNA ligase D [Sphingomonas sp.]